jgi:hypothetical protein
MKAKYLNGIALITAERQRQVEEEGWTMERDIQEHAHGDLADAAACYAATQNSRENTSILGVWPWDARWWKPTPNNRIRELAKAGALIAAEIDRLLNTPENDEQ